jgi:hypothetical protein
VTLYLHAADGLYRFQNRCVAPTSRDVIRRAEVAEAVGLLNRNHRIRQHRAIVEWSIGRVKGWW